MQNFLDIFSKIFNQKFFLHAHTKQHWLLLLETIKKFLSQSILEKMSKKFCLESDILSYMIRAYMYVSEIHRFNILCSSTLALSAKDHQFTFHTNFRELGNVKSWFTVCKKGQQNTYAQLLGVDFPTLWDSKDDFFFLERQMGHDCPQVDPVACYFTAKNHSCLPPNNILSRYLIASYLATLLYL